MGKNKSPASNYYIFELQLLHKVLQQSKLQIWHNLQGLHIPTRKIKIKIHKLCYGKANAHMMFYVNWI